MHLGIGPIQMKKKGVSTRVETTNSVADLNPKLH